MVKNFFWYQGSAYSHTARRAHRPGLRIVKVPSGAKQLLANFMPACAFLITDVTNVNGQAFGFQCGWVFAGFELVCDGALLPPETKNALFDLVRLKYNPDLLEASHDTEL